MKCEDCGIENETVEKTTCPFLEEIKNITQEIVVCKECYKQRLWDI